MCWTINSKTEKNKMESENGILPNIILLQHCKTSEKFFGILEGFV